MKPRNFVTFYEFLPHIGLHHTLSQMIYYVMVEADSHLKLLPTSILDIYKVFEHIDMLSMGIQHQPYTVIPTPLGLDFGALGHL
jgi:hypothetical protein